jgi:hypothetical protein
LKEFPLLNSKIFSSRPLRAGLFTFFAAFVTFALTGCGGGGGKATPSPDPGNGRVVEQPGWTTRVQVPVQSQRRKWTILVYMNGANDLEEYGSLNINQMETVGSTNEVNMVVQFKRIANRYDSSNGDWSNTRRYVVARDSNFSNVNADSLISERDNVDMGQAQTLQEFVRWGVETFPADRYAIVLWNHGAGWRSAKTRAAANDVTRGFSYDDVTGSHIDTKDLPEAINIDRKWT